jgi:hypothetical protein
MCSAEFLLDSYEIQSLVDEGGDSACPPKPPPALNAIITYHFFGVIEFKGGATAGGWNPVSVYLVI